MALLTFFIDFAKDKDIALMVITEINHVEIRQPKYKELFDKTSNLVIVKKGVCEFYVLLNGKKEKINLFWDEDKGIWREMEFLEDFPQFDNLKFEF